MSNPYRRPGSGSFIAKPDRLEQARIQIIRGQYPEAREILDTMPFNEQAKAMRRELAQLEFQYQQEQQRRQRYAAPRQGIPLEVAVLMLIVGLVAGGVGGFFFGRELLVREVTYAFGSALADFEMPTFEPFPTFPPLPTIQPFPTFEPFPTIQPFPKIMPAYPEPPPALPLPAVP